MPWPAIVARTSGSASTSFTTALRRARVAGGVAAGAKRPYQPAISTPGTPPSAKVGTSGTVGARAGAATATSLTRPSSDRVFAAPRVENRAVT